MRRRNKKSLGCLFAKDMAKAFAAIRRQCLLYAGQRVSSDKEVNPMLHTGDTKTKNKSRFNLTEISLRAVQKIAHEP
jgi:hypothetical protein